MAIKRLGAVVEHKKPKLGFKPKKTVTPTPVIKKAKPIPQLTVREVMLRTFQRWLNNQARAWLLKTVAAKRPLTTDEINRLPTAAERWEARRKRFMLTKKERRELHEKIRASCGIARCAECNEKGPIVRRVKSWDDPTPHRVCFDCDLRYWGNIGRAMVVRDRLSKGRKRMESAKADTVYAKLVADPLRADAELGRWERKLKIAR